MKNSFVHFLGGFEDTKKSFQNYLTFMTSILAHTKSEEIVSKSDTMEARLIYNDESITYTLSQKSPAKMIILCRSKSQ